MYNDTFLILLLTNRCIRNVTITQLLTMLYNIKLIKQTILQHHLIHKYMIFQYKTHVSWSKSTINIWLTCLIEFLDCEEYSMFYDDTIDHVIHIFSMIWIFFIYINRLYVIWNECIYLFTYNYYSTLFFVCAYIYI